MSKLRWGVLSTARIATEKVIPAIARSAFGEVLAIASRDAQRAQRAAERLGIPRHYGSYQDLLEDSDVDAVYIPLPNHLHVPWSIRTLEHGKHVLCEKPIGLSSQEARQLQAAAREHPQLKLMEAFMYRFHPQWQRAYEMVREGQVGELHTIQTFFSFFNDDPDNIRHRPEWGGGALMDIGCYPISLSRWLFGEEPHEVWGCLHVDSQFGVDRTVSGMLVFPSGGTATFTASMQVAPYQRVHIVGTDGRIEIEIPFNAPPDRPCRLIWQDDQGHLETLTFPTCDQYTVQADLFAQAVQNDLPVPTPLEDAIANMQAIEAVIASAQSGRTVRME